MNSRWQLIAFLSFVFISSGIAVTAADQKMPQSAASGADGGKQSADEARQRLDKMIKISKMPIKSNLKLVDVKGEVIDVWCYISETMGPGRGPSHLKCATLCIVGGMPLGIVEDKTGDVYVAAKSTQAYKGCFDQLKGYIGKTVIAHGFTASKGGCRVLRIQSVQEAK